MFKRIRFALIPALLALALALTACAGVKPAAGGAADKQKAAIADGVKAMTHEIEEIKEYLEAKLDDKVRSHAHELDEAWEAFEDDVRDLDKALYEEIEDPLHAILAGTKEGQALDAKLLTEQADKLQAVLAKLPK